MTAAFEKFNKEKQKAIKMHRLLHSIWETSKFSLADNFKFN